MSNLLPKKLCMYFGYPSLVNGAAGNINTAVNTFKQYDQVIFPNGLEDISHPDYLNTIAIINHPDMANTTVFGEIDSTKPFGQNKSKIDLWKINGAKGVFCNKFGFDYNVNRAQQNTLLDYIHSSALIAIVYTTSVDDAFCKCIHLTCNPLGQDSNISANDYYLALHYQVVNGAFQLPMDWKIRSDKMVNWRGVYGTKMACATTTNNTPFDQNKMDYAYFSTVLYNFDSFGYSEFNFSADNLLPFRTRKQFYGTRFDSPITIINDGDIYERVTNVGIHLNTSTHTVNILLD